ncbi:hypothetical protein EST38_g14210 [Candolleomyces aberdarensis]|uniref:Helitron helicase-like domain-containing protein n=1 Tax=Candolleomyces aberdarensis TaxID=2316362 RepID=A0A4Q2D0K1_9AGAR|nr:hypothetical protein EST38_g14210 [Candolleomyces aberdarensis]
MTANSSQRSSRPSEHLPTFKSTTLHTLHLRLGLNPDVFYSHLDTLTLPSRIIDYALASASIKDRLSAYVVNRRNPPYDRACIQSPEPPIPTWQKNKVIPQSTSPIGHLLEECLASMLTDNDATVQLNASGTQILGNFCSRSYWLAANDIAWGARIARSKSNEVRGVRECELATNVTTFWTPVALQRNVAGLLEVPCKRDGQENQRPTVQVFPLASEDHSVNRGRGEPVFRILGELYHQSGPLQPSSGHQPIYAQLYFYDPHEAQDQRASLNEGLNRQTLNIVHTTLDCHDPHAAIFRYVWEFMQHRSGGGGGDVTVRLRPAPSVHRRRGNIPTADEVAVIICDSNGEDPSPRDVVLHQCTGGLSVIHDLHPAYAPLYYVSLFPDGEPGWHPDLRMHQPTGRNNPHRLSQSRFVAYRLQICPNKFLTVLCGKCLLQRYLVDMYASINQNRLRYLCLNKPQLRACLYSGLQDSLSADNEEVDLNQLGQKVILPSLYIGGPQYMQQRY